MNLAGIDNENERSGRKEQDKWEKEMQDSEKLREWKSKHTILKPKADQGKAEPKTIQLKNRPQAK